MTKHFEQCVKIEISTSNNSNEWFSSKNDFKSWIQTQSCCQNDSVDVKIHAWFENGKNDTSSWPSLSYLEFHLRHQFVLLLFRTLNDLPCSKIATLWEEHWNLGDARPETGHVYSENACRGIGFRGHTTSSSRLS